ncbi:MAG: hypothetical protein Kow00120_27710 [Anaerolineae bacterium]
MRAHLPKPPTGVIDSLRMGFETLAGQPLLLLPPLLLDLLLWIGPRLSIRTFAAPAVEGLVSAMGAPSPQTPAVAQALGDIEGTLAYVAAHFNALSMLITSPLGVPSLVGRLAPEVTPEGVTPPVWELGSIWVALLVMAALALVGLLIGAAYLGMMANQVRHGALRGRALLRLLPRHWANLSGLALIMLSSLLVVATPFLCLASFLGMVSPLLAFVVLTVGLSVGLWTIVFLLFAAHTMLLKDRSLFTAIGESARVVQLNVASTIMLLLVIGLVYLGTSEIFHLVTPDSWLMVVGLAAHAFVATALFVATFVYYQDRYRHYQEFFAYLAANKQISSAGGQRGREG